MSRSSHLVALVEAARRARIDLTVDEWREIYYLAAHLGQASRWEPASEPERPGSSGEHAAGQPPVPPEPVLGADPPAGAPPPRSDASGGGFLAVGPSNGGSAARIQLPLRAMPDRSGIAKAFRPLKRRVDSPVEVELDIAGTVRRSADLGALQLVLVPAAERWFSVALLIDEAGSGPAWQREGRVFRRALEESGAFSGLKVWRFNSDAGVLLVHGETSASTEGRDGRELNDPTGRRAILVLSDCVGTGWGDGRVGALIDGWSTTSPVAVVNPLPQRMWVRCQPRLVAGEWMAGRPFRVGQPTTWRSRSAGSSTSGAVVPVVDFTVRSLSRWASLVAGAGTGWMSGTALCASVLPADDAGAGEPFETGDEGLAGPAEEYQNRLRVDRFQAAVSPQAFQLATALAAAPLQEPVIRAFQLATLGADQPTYWAELMLSGLIHRLDDGAAPYGADATYEFEPGLRQEFYTRMSRHRVISLLRQAGSVVAAELAGTPELVTLLLTASAEELKPADRPLARVSVEVMEALGGAYRAAASGAKRLLSAEVTRVTAETRKPGRYDAAVVDPRDGDHPVTPPNVTEAQLASGRTRDRSRTTIREVPPRLHHFTGRQELLRNLRQELVENPNRAAVLVPRALWGLGGVGKTALANEYAHRFGGEYDVVWWIPAEDPADVRRSLVQLSRELRLPDKTDQSDTIRELIEALETGYPKSSWLLIYDNATDPNDLRDLMPKPTALGHVLITSRNDAWAEGGTLLRVSEFTRSESIALLRRRASEVSEEDAERLAVLLKDLPLALNHAAAWHEETKLGTADYIQRYNEKMSQLPEDLLPEYPRPVGAAFGVSYDQLRSRSVAAAQLLQLCSHFGPEAISLDMLWRGRFVANLPSPLWRRLRDRTALQRELREVSRYELIQYDLTRSRFQLHRLVQLLLRDTLPADQRQTTLLHAQGILAMANPGNPDEIPVPEQIKHAELSPHILPSNLVEATDYESRKVVLDQIRYRYLIGDYESSRDLARAAVQVWERQHPAGDETLLLAKRHLATTLRASGDPVGSLDLSEQVYHAFRDSPDHGPDNEHTLASANSYASALRATGRFGEALEIDRLNREQHERILRDDPATLRSANNFAVDLRVTGSFIEAYGIDQSIVQRWTDMFGPDHPETLFAISNLVRDLYGLGRYGEALTMQQEALTVHDAVLGSTHPQVLMARRTVAMLFRKLGRYDEARERADVNYAAYRTRFPGNHEHTLAAAMSLVNALRDQNKDTESIQRARSLAEQTLAQYERAFPGHVFTFVCMANLALVLRRVGEVARARELNTTARERLIESLSESHPYVLCVSTNLANDLAASGDYQAARRLSENTLTLSRATVARGTQHPYTLAAAVNHALDLEAVGRVEEAGLLLTETVRLLRSILGPDHPDTLAAEDRRRLDADIEPPPT